MKSRKSLKDTQYYDQEKAEEKQTIVNKTLHR